MPKGQRDVIIGGGIQPAAPDTQFTVPMFADNLGMFLTDSLLRDVPAAGLNTRHISVGATEVALVGATAVETFRTRGGLISSSPLSPGSVVVGEGAVVTGAGLGRGAIAIGYNASAFNGGATDAGLVIGEGANDNAQADSTVIGQRAFAGGGAMVVIGKLATGQGGSGIVIGASAQCANTAGCFVIGQAANVQGANGMAVGNGSIAGVGVADIGAMAIGSGALCNGGHSLALGFNAQVIQNGANSESMAIGSGATVQAGLSNAVVVGHGCVAAHSNTILVGDRLASDVIRTFKAGFGAGGTATLPLWGVFFGGPDTYASYEGITYRHVNGLGVNNSVGPMQFVAPRGTGSGVAAVGGLFAGIEFYTGAVDAGGGAAIQASTLNFKVLPQGLVLTVTDAPVAFPNYRDGAGAAAGTLLNAPAAGNPHAWVPVNLKGVVHWFPAWHL